MVYLSGMRWQERGLSLRIGDGKGGKLMMRATARRDVGGTAICSELGVHGSYWAISGPLTMWKML